MAKIRDYQEDIIPGKIRRLGVSGNRPVVEFVGYGYWVLPAYVGIAVRSYSGRKYLEVYSRNPLAGKTTYFRFGRIETFVFTEFWIDVQNKLNEVTNGRYYKQRIGRKIKQSTEDGYQISRRLNGSFVVSTAATACRSRDHGRGKYIGVAPSRTGPEIEKLIAIAKQVNNAMLADSIANAYLPKEEAFKILGAKKLLNITFSLL